MNYTDSVHPQRSFHSVKCYPKGLKESEKGSSRVRKKFSPRPPRKKKPEGTAMGQASSCFRRSFWSFFGAFGGSGVRVRIPSKKGQANRTVSVSY